MINIEIEGFKEVKEKETESLKEDEFGVFITDNKAYFFKKIK